MLHLSKTFFWMVLLVCLIKQDAQGASFNAMQWIENAEPVIKEEIPAYSQLNPNQKMETLHTWFREHPDSKILDSELVSALDDFFLDEESPEQTA